MPFTIISPTPGPTTKELILELILTHPEGITVKSLSDRLNRPVSMINYCLKDLKNSNFIQAKLNPDHKQLIYYPVSSFTGIQYHSSIPLGK
ncbi:winged helix-turn-helix transcriptional regulator [Crocosphaera chwakensis]|uniref:Cobaltochelatase n=1 Tax=Crocosphaera chwakensis CCY0110 TaxID=391612 RepID=A3IYH2_9CHRO|nr:winged helix-turn-helix domain-containing protein [Crocosphaera chwakensis]EAZ88462.1 cobaltochelatase [Crocosphaera chwakensis CCY0110]